jgi:septal ring factor EnvC (AmiA/AmiB activator)
MSENTEPEETVTTATADEPGLVTEINQALLEEVNRLLRADRRHRQRLDRIGRRLAKRDKRLAGMERKIQQLETALATRTIDIDSLSRKLRREAQDAEAGLEAIRAERAENRKIHQAKKTTFSSLWMDQPCTQRLREEGKAYPRTCQLCGLPGLGSCPYPSPTPES